MIAWIRTKWALAVVLMLLGLVVGSALRLAKPSTEAVRLRNALLFEVSQPGDLDWTPDRLPRSFATDEDDDAGEFHQIASALQLHKEPDDLQRALRIAEHLLANARHGNAARDDLKGTYLKIRAGHGYCSDFTTVFIAVARAAKIFAREWAFSFDGFGGHGHALVEVYNRDARVWQMIDVFNGWVPVDKLTNAPLSVAAFRSRLPGESDTVHIARIGESRFGFRDDEDLWNYYRAGADQWYLWWGNAVHRYDQAWPTRLLGRHSRSLEQLASVAVGIHPRVHALPTPSNRDLLDRMQSLKRHLLILLFAGIALGAVLAYQIAHRCRIAVSCCLKKLQKSHA